MDGASSRVRILVVRPWTQPIAPIRAALRDAGYAARIFRVDIEPALEAALARDNFDAIIFDPSTKGFTLDSIEAHLREHRRLVPIVTLERIETLAAMLEAALRTRLN